MLEKLFIAAMQNTHKKKKKKIKNGFKIKGCTHCLNHFKCQGRQGEQCMEHEGFVTMYWVKSDTITNTFEAS